MEMMTRFLTDAQQRRLLEVAKEQSSLLAQRDYAWMRLLIETGMRVNELATMTKGQAERALHDGWLVIGKEQRKGSRRPGKNEAGEYIHPVQRKAHGYVVTEPVRKCLEALLHLQQELSPALVPELDMEPPLLWGRCGVVRGKVMCEHMSVRSFQARMKHWAYLAGLPNGVSPHWLRHTRGVNIVRRSRSKNPVKVVQLALGHANISSTGVYTQIRRDEFEADMRVVAGGRVRKAVAMRAGGAV